MAVVFLTGYSATDQTYNVPSDWNNSTNTVEVVSHAGLGATATSGSGGNGGGGGGGGGYAKATNVTLTPGGTATYRLRDAGAGNADANACWFNGTSLAGSSVGIRGGSNASNATGGAGALTTNAIGATTRAGGTGATASTASGNVAGGGGGGAAGLAGVGGNASGTTGGTGDGGATAATASGTQWDGSHGSGGGGTGGAAGNNAGGNGGQYGAGAGGGGKTNGAAAAAGTSRGGLIVLTYTPAITTKTASDSLLPKIDEAKTLASSSTRTDSVLPKITEGTAGLTNQFSTTESATPKITESSLVAEGWDLQVRGVNVTGDGAWSNTATVWLPYGEAVEAPTLVWLSPVADDTPEISLTGDIIEADIVIFQLDTVNTFDGADFIEVTNTLDSGEAAGDELDFTSGALTDDTWYARARIDRGGTRGAWSNTVNQTIDSTAPTITSSSTFSIDENDTIVGTITANESATFDITGGVDAALLSVNPITGELEFNLPPDYETPLDADTDNDYVIEITATDDAGNPSTPQSITITVNDVSDVGGDTTTGLVSYWPFTDQSGTTAADSGPAGHDLTVDDGSNWGGDFLQFKVGTGEFAYTADDTDYTAGNNITVISWINALVPAGNGWIAGQWDNGANDRAWLMGIDTSGNLRAIVTDVASGANRHDYTSSMVVADGLWHSVGFRWNAGVFDLFIDGIKDTSPTVSQNDSFTTLNDSSAHIVCGGMANSFPTVFQYFEGMQRNLRIYTGTNKTDADILSIHELHAPDEDVTTGLVSYWQFYEGTGATAYDLVSGHDLTVPNTGHWGPGGYNFTAADNTLAYVADHADFTPGSNITIFGWVKASPDVECPIITQFDYSTPNRSWEVTTDSTTGEYLHTTMMQSESPLKYKSYIGSQVLLDGTYHSFAVRFNSGVLDLFVDGVRDTSVTKDVDDSFSTVLDSTAELRIGTWNSAFASFGTFKGSQFRLYIGTNKTNAEIAAMHARGL